jgi:hypothetical protein
MKIQWGSVGESLSLALRIFHESLLLTPGFFHENEEISTPPPCGFLIGIYLFYENWSTETFVFIFDFAFSLFR